MNPPIKLNVHIYPSYLTNESRILREAKSLTDMGLVQHIAVIGYHKPGLPSKEFISANITFYRTKPLIPKRSGKLKFLNILSFATFYFAVVKFCLQNRPAVINAHSLTVLPIGVLLKFLTKGKLIYDAHELETETNESRGIRKIIAKRLERLFIRKADHVIVVAELIRRWYAETYNIENISTIKNIPESPVVQVQTSVIRNMLKLNSKDIIFLYVGSLEYGRGIKLLLDAFRDLDDFRHLVFMGYGSYADDIRRASAATSNIHYLNAVPVAEVLDYVSGADVGICLIENTCLSYYYCLPNKSFEYLAAGIPFISSDFPELVNEFESQDICWFSALKIDAIKNTLTSITAEAIENKKRNVLERRGLWSWADEKRKYLKIYKNL